MGVADMEDQVRAPAQQGECRHTREAAQSWPCWQLAGCVAAHTSSCALVQLASLPACQRVLVAPSFGSTQLARVAAARPTWLRKVLSMKS